jgi:hypothetical protein
MRLCLTHPDLGYYTRANHGSGNNIFGASGDFVTSPEISQVSLATQLKLKGTAPLCSFLGSLLAFGSSRYGKKHLGKRVL